MAIPKNKFELLKDIETSCQKLRADIVDIPEEQAVRKEMDGHVKGTKMSVCNLMAYLVGWGNLVIKWREISSQGKMPDLPETGFKMNEMGKLALKFYKDYEDDGFKVLLKKYDTVVQEILDMVKAMDNEELYEVEWHKKYPFGRMVQFNTSSPYKNARARIRKWKREKELI